LLDPKWVTRHRGGRAAFLARHRRQARRVLKVGRSALAAIAPSLLFRASHEKVLRLSWDYLQEHGGQAPGPDGLRYDDPTEPQLWRLLRDVRDGIRAGTYVPDEERVRWIAKGPGRGRRPLVIQSIVDRVVQRALVEITQPLVDPRFDARSFGFRPRRSALDALALAEHLFLAERRRVWVTADVKDAFLRVPLPRLFGVVRRYLFADDLVEFIGVVIGGSLQPGLRQGGCLSPLLLNLYLHHCLDRQWRKHCPDVPLLRYADDVALLCRSAAEARQAYRALEDLLCSAGMALKQGCEEAVRTLTAEAPACWLGFQVERAPQGLRFGLTEEAWWKLEEKLVLAHEEPDAPVRVFQAIVGWVGQKGPCYPHVDRDAAYARLAAIAREQAFDEIPDRSDVRQLWQRSFARWAKVRARARHARGKTAGVSD
jgi:hypothetical protein